jgi:ribosomal protein S8
MRKINEQYIPFLRNSRDEIVKVLQKYGYIPDSHYPEFEGKYDTMVFSKKHTPYDRLISFHNYDNQVLMTIGHIIGVLERLNPLRRMYNEDPKNEEELLSQIRSVVKNVEEKWFPNIEEKDSSTIAA